MIYLSSFKLSDRNVKNPNIYPYNVFRRKDMDPFVFAPITVLYGNNGSGKSTILNIIANKLMLKGKEYAASNSFGIVDYCGKFSSECQFSYGEDEFGNLFRRFPENSRFIKSEDILYEIKKIQQRQILSDGMEYDYMKNGNSRKEAEEYFQTREGRHQIEYIEFAQEKYSNGETAMQFFEEYLLPDALYLLDEPEVSLSPANQVLLAKEINKLARLLSCQFIIATHSPFMLGTLDAKIYNIDKEDYSICKWYELENVRYFYIFSENMRRNLKDNVQELFSKRAITSEVLHLNNGEKYGRETNGKLF